MSKPVALVPAYNPSTDLIPIIQALQEAERFEAIYAVDDGSDPCCAEIFQQLRSMGVLVHRHYINLGKGMALRTGLNVIATSHPDTPGIVTFDADGQHVPADITNVADALVQDAQALTLGARELPADAPLRSRFGNALTRHVMRFFTGATLSDTQTGLRGIPLTLVPELLRLRSSDYDFELDMLIRAHRQGFAMHEIPIQAVYLEGNASSHFNPVIDSMKIYFVFFRYCSVSLLTAGIDYTIFAFMYLASRHILLSILLARFVAASFQFYMSYSFVFRAHENRTAAVLKYLAVLTVLTLLAYTGIYIFDALLGVSPLIAKILVEGSIFIVSFLLLRDFVFVPKESE